MAFPASDEIHLLLVEEEKVDEVLLAQYSLLLSSDEIERHDRIRTVADRRRFLTTRAAIRTALSHCVPDIAPADWQFTCNDDGRPAIAGPVYASGLTFNISHAQGMVAIAIAREGMLGVDVESVCRVVDTMAVARRYFAPDEVSELQARPEAEQRILFFDLWTLKEAWVKATGKGLAKSLHHVSFALAENKIEVRFSKESRVSSDPWHFWQLRPTERHQIAVAYAAKSFCESGPCPRSPMILLVNDMVPMRPLTTRDLPPFRAS